MTSLIQILGALPWVDRLWIDRLASTLIQFLWQGALIALIYALLRSVFTRTRTTAFRYGLSCAALLAMMIAPIATFVMSAPTAPIGAPASSVISVAGSLAPSHPATTVTWFAPMTDAVFRTWRDDTTTWIVLAWFIGAIAFWARLAGGWLIALRIRRTLVRPAPADWQLSLDHLRMRLSLSRPVRLLVSAVVQVPTVVGWLRPVVLVPLGALTGLEPELIEALLAHELAHVRRHDYLVNVLQGVAETMLFYHPAVWWVSNQIREERELCCDDIAVAVCGDTLTYVRALTELESCRPAHMNPALAANGGSLADRVARLLGVSRASGTIAGPGVTIGTCLIVIGTALGALAQSTSSAPPPAFEVASVKQNKSGAARSPSQILPGGRFTATNNTVRALILNAYDITGSPSLLSGGPGWIDSEAYDIDARPAANAIPAGASGKPLWDKTRLMLRTLLADRFQLSMHRESKEMSIYELVVAKNGPKLKATAADCNASVNACHSFSGNPRRETGTGVDTYDIALMLTSRSDTLVVDKTGIQGMFDVLLQWNPFYGRPQQPADDSAGAPGAGKEGPMPDLASLPSVFDALEQQVGLKLQAHKGPVDAWVIDRVERPSEN